MSLVFKPWCNNRLLMATAMSGLFFLSTQAIAQAESKLPANTVEEALSFDPDAAHDKHSPPAGAHGRKDPHAALSAEKLIQVALQHHAEGRSAEAINTLNEAIAKHNDAKLYAVRGSLLLEQGRVSKALPDLEKSLELKPDDPLTLTNRAQAYRQFGRIAESLADLNRAIELDPDLIAARFNRGAIHYSSEEHEAALHDFDHCIAVDPHNPAPYFNRAAVHDALGRRDAAVADLNRFLELSDNETWNKTAKDLLQRWKSGSKNETDPS